MCFAENLFHFKVDQPQYSIKPADYDTLPLFVDNKSHKTLLNEFFFYVLSKVSSWQSMKDMTVTSMDDVTELIVNSKYLHIEASKSGPELPAVPCVSRNMIAYITSFLSVAPFFRAADPRVTSRTDKYYAVALATLSKTNDKDLVDYVHRKATAWYRRFPPVGSPDRIDDDDKLRSQADGGGAANENDPADEDRGVVMSDAEEAD